jgi:hypothetical protein
VVRLRSWCDNHPKLKLEFNGDRPPAGWQYCVFAQDMTEASWYPSREPQWDGKKKYETEVFTDREPEYWIQVSLVDEQAAASIRDYLVARGGDSQGQSGDGLWGMGMNLDAVPGCKIKIAKVKLPGPCS